jgi:hypothetical protein
VYRSGEGWRLTTQEKKRILLNNIFGVDIDRQAVEVTKLSLLLKVLEDENRETIGKNLALFRERVLPNLDSNIKCGNSLIGSDFYSGSLPLMGEDENLKKINPFDWHDPEKGFGKIMNPSQSPLEKGGNKGGFDAVIGNPPYVRQEMLGEFKPYFQSNYKTYHGMADIYVYFIEKAVSLLKDGGQFSYIVANKWMRANYGEPIRKWMKGQEIEEITDFGDLPVFQNATTYPCILRIGKRPIKSAKTFRATKVETLEFQDLQQYVESKSYSVRRDTLNDSGWSLASAKENTLLSKIKSSGIPLGEYVKGEIFYGIKTGLNEAFVIDAETRKKLIKEDPKSAELIKSFLVGKDIKRYSIADNGRYLILIPKGWTRDKAGKSGDAWEWLRKNYPTIVEHLSSFQKKAEKRYDKGEYWWELRACDYYNEFKNAKIVWGNMAVSPQFAFDINMNYINAPAVFIPSSNLYLLAIMNSPICKWFIQQHAATRSGGFLEYKPMYVSQLPIRTIDFNNKKEKAMHDQVVSLVDKMLDLNEKLKKAKTPHDSELIERQIKATDSQIDKMVYELYGLTEEEIKVVEEEKT